MAYGVVPTGFERKRVPEIIADLEAAHVATFGPDVIQSAASPLGQMNGLHADLAATAWEIAEAVYQSLDPDQAEGARLEQIAKLRLLARGEGEDDISFRQAITNAGRARIDMADIVRALRSLTDVTFVAAFVNDGDAADANGIAGHSIAVAILGGDDDEIARTIRAYVVPGIGTYGNTTIETEIDGFCRSIRIIRPVELAVAIEVDIIANPDPNGCPPPGALSIAAGLAQALTGENRPRNGQDVTEYLVRREVESRYPNVEVAAVRASVSPAAPDPVPLAIGFFQIMAVSASRITVATV